MKTFIIDWGEGANGARYALIQARNLEEAWGNADAIGGPFKIAELKIPSHEPECGGRYMEIDFPENPYEGATPDQLKWKHSSEADPTPEARRANPGLDAETPETSPPTPRTPQNPAATPSGCR